ncbi:hypothetical protein GGF46_000356 [Coemansia sp. RSA 552]|nr:hypothetical protein GGF46_000356 [Coemansia sp. RSA 552]
MGLLKRIKNSYVFTQLEVGKYTRRRTSGQHEAAVGVVRPAMSEEFISEFDRAAEELRAEQDAEERRQQQQQSYSADTLAMRAVGRVRSSMDLTAAQRERLDKRGDGSSPRTAVASPQTASPSPSDAGLPGTVRARPRPTRAARSQADIQSVYFAPGRNVTMTNQQRQRMSVYASEEPLPSFDKNSASSTDYYVYAPTANQMAQVPLDQRRRQLRGLVQPEPRMAPEMHRDEVQAECERLPTTNPFVQRSQQKSRSPAMPQAWDCHTPFSDTPAASAFGVIDPNHPRKHLNTPVYANQTGSSGLDLLA